MNIFKHRSPEEEKAYMEEMRVTHPESWWLWYNNDFLKELHQVSRRFPPSVIRQIVTETLKEKVSHGKMILEREYAEYTLLHEKGIPYTERRKILNEQRISMMREKIQEWETDLKGFRVRDLDEWCIPGDYERMKRIGFKNFIKLFCPFAYEQTGSRY